MALLPTLTNNILPCPFQAAQTSSIFPSNLFCLCSKPSVINSPPTTNPDLICLWINALLYSGETFTCKGEQNLSLGQHYTISCSSLLQKCPPHLHHIAGHWSWSSCINAEGFLHGCHGRMLWHTSRGSPIYSNSSFDIQVSHREQKWSKVNDRPGIRI